MERKEIVMHVSLHDFYSDGDDYLQDELISFITSNVYDKIWHNVKVQIEERMQKEIIATINQKFEEKISNIISGIVDSNEFLLKNQNYTGDDGKGYRGDITIAQFIKSKFLGSSGWANPNDKIESIAKNFSVELKKRYDVLFASQIVNKMSEQGLLKDEAIQKLLNT